jgi:hypothetical protein
MRGIEPTDLIAPELLRADRVAWTEQDDASLLAGVASGEPWACLAGRLGRTYKACLARHKRLTRGLAASRAAAAPAVEGEQWRPLPRSDRHEVSNLGRVRLAVRGHFASAGAVLAQKRERNGYWRVSICNDGRVVQYHVARLVLEAFVGPPPTPEHHAAHGDGDQSNNRLDNLRWAPPAENQADKWLHGTVPAGEKSPHAKLTEAQVAEIRRMKSEGASFGELQRLFPAGYSTLKRIVDRDSWRHVA